MDHPDRLAVVGVAHGPEHHRPESELAHRDARAAEVSPSHGCTVAESALAPNHPTPCREPVTWMGFRPAFGKPKVRFYTCEKHRDELTDLRPVNR